MKYLTICIAFLLFSCSGSTQEKTDSPAEVKKSSVNGSCLTDVEDPTEWYSLTDVSAIAGVPEGSINQNSSTGRYNTLSFRWDEDRDTKKWSDIHVSIVYLDDIIEKREKRYKRTYTYEEYFDSFHTLETNEEREIIDEAIEKKGEEDENFDADMAKKILSSAPTQDFENIRSVGDKANKYVQTAPGLRELRLSVLHRNVAIMVNVDISDDDNEDLTVAKKIAERIMELCD